MTGNFIDSSKIKKAQKKERKQFKDSNIDISHYKVNSPKIIKSIPINF